MTTENATTATADTKPSENPKTVDRVRQAASEAAERGRTVAQKAAKRIDEATETTVDSAKRHPVSAAAIAVGAAAAVAGAAFGVTKLVEKRKAAPKSAKPKTDTEKKASETKAAPRRRKAPAKTANGTTTH